MKLLKIFSIGFVSFLVFFISGVSTVIASTATGSVVITINGTSCGNGATNPPDCNDNNTTDGSLSASPSPCVIATGSTCTTKLTLNISSPVSGASTNITKTGNVEVASGITPSIKSGIVVGYPSTTFFLNHNGITLNSVTVSAICPEKTGWDPSSSSCSASVSPSTTEGGVINGGWGDWVGRSLSCGVSGVETRYCNNPAPENGGKLCTLENGSLGTTESKSYSNSACSPLSCPGGLEPICPSSCPPASSLTPSSSVSCPSTQKYDAVTDKCIDKKIFNFIEK